MGGGRISRRCRLAGYAAATCMLTIATAPANAQTQPALDAEAAEQATTPVAQVADRVSGVAEHVAAAVEPVSGATGQATTPVSQTAVPVSGAAESVAQVAEPLADATGRVAAAVEPVSRAAGQVTQPVSRAAGDLAGAAQPVLDATGRVVAAAEPVTRSAGELVGAARPVLDATAGVAGSVAAPVDDVVDDITRPVGGALTGDRSSRADRGATSQQDAAFGGSGSGRPPGGPAADAGSTQPSADGLSRGPALDTPLAGVTFGPSPAGSDDSPGGLPGRPLTTVASDPLGALAPALATRYVPLPDLARVIGRPWPETSTSTSPTDRHPVLISPGRQPAPAPSAPAGASAAGAGSGGSAGPVLALLALLLLAAPSLSQLFRAVPEFLRPAPFIVALERPG